MKTSHIIAIIIAVVVIGTIGFLGVVALIAVPSLTGIQNKAQVNADIRTAEMIAKSIEIWSMDGVNREVPSTAIEYDELIDYEYIQQDMEPASLENGEFYVINDNGTIKVAIAREVEDVNNLISNEVNYDGTGAGWAYIEGSN